MNLLFVHNYYGSSAPSGENKVFDSEVSLLRNRGHRVSEFKRYSDVLRERGALGKVQGAMATIWNPWMASSIKQKVESFNPDVTHVHNTFPLISPSIFHSVKHLSARVLTLHNYRLFCPAAIPMRNGIVCTDCIDQRSVASSIRYGCYRGSRLATLPLAGNISVHRRLGTWENEVDAFIVLSEFQRELVVKAGLSAELVHVKPNFFPEFPAVIPFDQRPPHVVFVGRLSGEKGVMSLLQAWREWGHAAPELRILGDGDLKDELNRYVALNPGMRVRFLGKVDGAIAKEEIARARLLVLPSECLEGFPMVLGEAFAFGTPVAVSSLGPLPSIVHKGLNGVLFKAGDPVSLLKTVRNVWENPVELPRLSAGARKAFEVNYTEEANYIQLMKIYEQAIALSKRKGEQLK